MKINARISWFVVQMIFHVVILGVIYSLILFLVPHLLYTIVVPFLLYVFMYYNYFILKKPVLFSDEFLVVYSNIFWSGYSLKIPVSSISMCSLGVFFMVVESSGRKYRFFVFGLHEDKLEELKNKIEIR